MRRPLVILVAGMISVAAGCKTPRTPHRAALEDLTGNWQAQSLAPVPLGWSFRLDQRDAGRIVGSGTLNDGAQVSSFAIRGLRGPHEINLDFHLAERRARFEGSVASVDEVVGRVILGGDTIKLTLERREAAAAP